MEKNTPVEHKFACDGFPCTSKETELTYLNFGHEYTFVDTTAVLVRGTVSIANTANLGPTPCPIEAAEVCALNHYGSHERIICNTTDALGKHASCLGKKRGREMSSRELNEWKHQEKTRRQLDCDRERRCEDDAISINC